ncbi:MAG TPA: hypothetical protein VKG43_13095 [Acidimicrobiales bacterium]|nr:hypothetical protein [Acidimicrobiales bacterium]
MGALSLAGTLGLGAGVAGAVAGPNVKATPDIVPASAAGAPGGAAMTVKWQNLGEIPGYTKAGGIAVTECNPGVLMGDQQACNQNPANLQMPGGPYLGRANTAGNGHLAIAVVSGAVGDGTCNPGEVCFLVVTNANPSAPVEYGLVPFAINPAA